MQNRSGLKPVGFAVLVQHFEPEKKESLIVMPQNVSDRNSMIEQRAVVIEVGDEAWKGEKPRAKPGDKVLISKNSGYLARGIHDNELYRIVNDQDIFALIEDDKSGKPMSEPHRFEGE